MVKKLILLFLSLCVLTAIYFLFFVKTEVIEINTFDDCLNAGYPVMESYPRQCKTPDGKSFFEEVNEVRKREYYGSSTFYVCEINDDCVISGCNGEVCQGLEEEAFASVCLFPQEPLPIDLGYECGCLEEKCQWFKD